MSTQAQFETWWKHEGSGMPPGQGEDTEAHVRRICEMAWSNGAYSAGLDELVRELAKLPRYEEDPDGFPMVSANLGSYVRFDELVAVLKRFEAKLGDGK